MAGPAENPPPAGTALPPISALQQTLSDLSLSSPTATPETQSHLHLAVQIAHNLRYQHSWTEISLHTAPTLPRPLLSGRPPQRLYIHPDEQIALLQRQKSAGKTGLPELESEREWVLPTQLREKWSLRKFGEVFDVVGCVPPPEGGERKLFEEWDGTAGEGGDGSGNEWRTEKAPKRILLATVDDDSTVVYYIVHDGMVKPRQN